MSPASKTDAVTVTTVVRVPPARAFERFTREVNAWWRRGPRFRFHPQREGRLAFEPPAGNAPGRFVEVFGPVAETWVIGEVRCWEPGARLVFGWRQHGFEAAETTEVEVRFEAVSEGTRVTVEHRGWDALPADHPVRRGFAGPAFTFLVGGPWSDQLVALAAHAEA